MYGRDGPLTHGESLPVHAPYVTVHQMRNVASCLISAFRKTPYTTETVGEAPIPNNAYLKYTEVRYTYNLPR